MRGTPERPETATRILDGDAYSVWYETFGAAICIHLLEHIPANCCAIAKLYLALKLGGWTWITVPIWLDRPTFEGSSITARRVAVGFWRSGYVRIFGRDFAAWLGEGGFQVEMDGSGQGYGETVGVKIRLARR